MASKNSETTTAKKQVAKVTPLTVDMSKRIEDMTPQELRAFQKRVSDIAKEKAAKEKAEKSVLMKKADDDVPEEPKTPVQFVQGSGLIEMSLSSLVPLDAGFIPDGDYAMRKIDENHCKRLLIAIENGDTLPPISATLTNYGTVVYDGYHRWEAYSRHMKNGLLAEGRISTLDPDKQTAEDKQAIDEAYQTYLVMVEEKDFESVAQLIKAAFEANLKHGLGSADPSRSRYGLWLFKYQQDIGQPISFREAARQAGVQYGTLCVARDRALGKKKHPKMVDALVSPEDEEEIKLALAEQENDRDDDRTVDNDDKHVKNLIAAARYFSTQDWLKEGAVTPTTIDYFRPMLAKVTRDEVHALDTVVASFVHIVNHHKKEQSNGSKAHEQAGQLL